MIEWSEAWSEEEANFSAKRWLRDAFDRLRAPELYHRSHAFSLWTTNARAAMYGRRLQAFGERARRATELAHALSWWMTERKRCQKQNAALWKAVIGKTRGAF